MKKILFFVALMFCFSVFSYGQTGKVTTRTLAEATGQTNLIPATLVKVCLERAAETEFLFGFAPGTLVREVQFVKDDEDREGAFSHLTPHRISLVASQLERGYMSERESFIYDSLDYGTKSKHETTHAVAYSLGILGVQDSSFLVLFSDTTKAKRLFQLVYTELDPGVCFFHQKVEGYRLEAGFKLTSTELIAQTIATLDSYCWEDKVKVLFKQDKDAFRLYGRTLFLIRDSIQRNPKTANAPVITLLEDHLRQMKKISNP